MAKYDRLLFILNLLRSRKNLTAARLAHECGVTERSIYRDLIALSQANVPIYFDHGYKLASDNFLPPLNFDLQEFRCLKTALESSPLAELEPHREILKRVRVKVEASLSRAVKDKKRLVPETTHINIELSLNPVRLHEHFMALEKAIVDSTCVNISYEGLSGDVSHRTIEPIFIIFKGHAFYTVAFCRMRRDLRTFRLDRIRTLKTSGETFTQNVVLDPLTYFADSWLLQGGELVEVKVRFAGTAARVVQSGRHHENEVVEPESDGSVLWSLKVRGEAEIARWLLGFGEEAEVLQPLSLRMRLRMVGRYFVATYADD
jgi:predicted DNA-binding transcriptional regulator YafY